MTCYHYYLWFLCYDRLTIGQKVQATWHYNASLYLLSNDLYWLLFANFSTWFNKKKHCEFRILCQKVFFSKRWNNKKSTSIAINYKKNYLMNQPECNYSQLAKSFINFRVQTSVSYGKNAVNQVTFVCLFKYCVARKTVLHFRLSWIISKLHLEECIVYMCVKELLKTSGIAKDKPVSKLFLFKTGFFVS